MRYTIFVVDQVVGELSHDSDRCVFTYAPRVHKDRSVSVTMPVRKAPYEYGQLHPIFASILPVNTDVIGAAPRDPLQLLAACGPGIGRVAAKPSGDVNVTDLSDELDSDDRAIVFANCIAEQGPIVLPGPRAQCLRGAWALRGATRLMTHAAINEYYCHRAARIAGVVVPPLYLSRNGRLAIVRRADISDRGEHYGYENVAALRVNDESSADSAITPHSVDVAEVVNRLRRYVNTQHSLETLRNIFVAVAMANVMRCDVHYAMFCIVYNTPDDVRMAPIDGFLSIAPYGTQPSLRYDGKIGWMTARDIIRFGRSDCNLTQRTINNAIRSCVDSARSVMRDITRDRARRAQQARIMTLMVDAWRDGIAASL